MSSTAPILILCNGANVPAGYEVQIDTMRLNYRDHGTLSSNVRIGLPDFVRNVYHLPNRMLDLLELAAYVYCADRMKFRGDKSAVEYQAWARSLHFVVNVRDVEFWERPEVTECLSSALEFMTGDRRYQFSFTPGQVTPKTTLFDDQMFTVNATQKLTIALFSGGLDSLSGAINQLEFTDNDICLVSHQSQAGTVKTQNQLVKALKSRYPDRVFHYKFQCNLKGLRAKEETQRSRAFLYTSIAFAISNVFDQKVFTIFENGITTLNFPRRTDLFDARASRTTHPKTMHLLSAFFSLAADDEISIESPFLWKTKTDVITLLKNSPNEDLITSTVSCSKTFKVLGQCTHCGGCSQCIDRRFATYASKVEDIDDGSLYGADIIGEAISDRETKTTVVDYVRQAKNFDTWSEDYFGAEMLLELSDIVEYLPDECGTEFERSARVFDLCKRHGAQVALALRRIRDLHDSPYAAVVEGSVLDLIAKRDYLKDPISRLVDRISELLAPGIPRMFAKNRPKNEADLNDKISAFLRSHEIDLRKEHPAVLFGCAHVIPDHGSEDADVFVEAKYLRNATTPSKATEGISADLTKYPQDKYILFVVYDPDRAIREDDDFVREFESRGPCTVLIVR